MSKEIEYFRAGFKGAVYALAREFGIPATSPWNAKDERIMLEEYRKYEAIKDVTKAS